jgi:AcrR family transcriptional regulator
MTVGFETQLEWITPPCQERTHRTLARLLDASEELLATRDFAGISVAEIANRADSSVGAFYRRFRDKDALLHALHERYNEEAFATAEVALDLDRWQKASVPEILGEFVSFLVGIDRERRGLRRAVSQRALMDPAFHERTLRLRRYLTDGVSRLLEARRAEIEHADPRIAASFILRQILGVLAQGGLADDAYTDERLAAELTRACVSYLGSPEVSSDSRPIESRDVDVTRRPA